MKKTTIALFLSAMMLPFLSGCGEAKASAAGKYNIDKEALKKTALEMMPKAMTESEAFKKEFDKQMADMTGVLELGADNKASLTMTGQQSIDASGTWKLEGEKLTLTMKEKEGKEESKDGTLKDGVITLTEEKNGQKMTMIFRK